MQLARFLGRAYTQPGPTLAGFADQQFEPVAMRLFPLLRRVVVADADELRHRMRLIVAMVTTLFATVRGPGEPGPLGTDDVDEQLRRLIAFCAAGLAAPATGAGT